jgi:zinc protease
MHKKLSCRTIVLALLAILFPFLKASAQNIKALIGPDSVLQFDPAVRTGKLANGLTYFIRRNNEPQKRALFYLVSKAGSILEDDNERGLAHFIEHMSFNGTKHFPKNELVSYLQKSGVRFGADINAYTSFNETVYELPLPTDKPKLINNGLQILRDWAQDATLRSEDIDAERGVIMEEKRLRKGADERMRNNYLPTLLNFSKYANRIPIGTEDVILNARPETIRKFYHDWYRPDLQAVIIVGDIDPARMEKLIKEKFSDLKNPADERPRTDYVIPLTGKSQFIAVTDKEVNTESALIAVKHHPRKLNTTTDYRRMMIEHFINQMLRTRYSELSRASEVPFVSGSARLENGLGGVENFTVSVTSNPGELDNAINAAWKEIERIRRFGFEQSELDRSKRLFMDEMSAAFNEKDKTNSAALVQEYTEYFLNGTSAPGIEQEVKLSKELIISISLDEVNLIATKAITGPDMDIVVTGPETLKVSLLSRSDVNGLMRNAASGKLERYQVKENLKPLLSLQPKGGLIVGRSYDRKLNLTKLELSNGVKVFLKPTDFKNDEIVFNGYSRGGTSLYPDKDYQSAVSANFIPSFGAGNYGATDMESYLNQNQMRVQPFINERIQGFTGITTKTAALAAMELLYGYATEPVLDTALFKIIINRSKTGIASRSGNPEIIYQDTLNAIITNHNIRKTPPSLEKLKNIDINKAFAIYKDRFADASDFSFFFSGNIDTLTFFPLIEKYLGSLPANHNHFVPKDLDYTIPAGSIEKTVFKGLEQKSTVTMIYSGSFDYNILNKSYLSALKDIIQIRLIERLREEESGVYAPKAVLNSSKYPKSQYSISISFGCAPENVAKLSAAVENEIEKLKLSGPGMGDLEKYKAESKRTLEAAMSTNNFWASYLNLQTQINEDPEQIFLQDRLIDKTSVNDLKIAANQYLSGQNLIKVVLLPEQIKAVNNPQNQDN